MHLIFEQGDHDAPVGHGLIYWRGDDGSVLATYVSVLPIKFDLTRFMPGIFANMMQGIDLGQSAVATPIPPVPEAVESLPWLQRLAERRRDDLVYAGGAASGDPMALMSQAAEAAQAYADLYGKAEPEVDEEYEPVPEQVEVSRYAAMDEQALLAELTQLTGRLRGLLRDGQVDAEIEREMRAVAMRLPAKYRAADLVRAAAIPGERGQRLAELYIERSYKLYREEYLDLERLDREIEAASE